MQKFIRIKSKGEIEEKAFSLIGASSKRDDNTKIGTFGSGLKYAIAFLLRNSIEFKVFSGYKIINFTTEDDTFRDKMFKIIYINGKPTSMTTDMGVGMSGFNHWGVIREIFCNSVDEGDYEIKVVEVNDGKELEPIEDFTTFYFKVTPEFQEIINNWNNYFSFEREDILYHDKDGNALYTGGEKTIVYRKGILCQLVPDQKSMFHYDMEWIKINESRVIENDWQFKWDLRSFLMRITDISIIRRIFFIVNECWERNINWDCLIEYSDTWKTALVNKVIIPHDSAGFWIDEIKYLKERALILPNNMVTGLKQKFGDDVYVIGDGDVKGANGEMKIIEVLGKRQQKLLDQSVAFLKGAEYQIKYPIKIAQFMKAERLGQAKDETIFLSEKLFDMGKKEIVSAIIEENEHLITGYKDESRAFQNHFIFKYISALEDKNGIYL